MSYSICVKWLEIRPLDEALFLVLSPDAASHFFCALLSFPPPPSCLSERKSRPELAAKVRASSFVVGSEVAWELVAKHYYFIWSTELASICFVFKYLEPTLLGVYLEL
ncbi:hypothetical protein KFK09_014323 [Dendrobium nobile]|uniref:Uncharacterized protein n=1 Tax=Dendrobium nobile TaxID=94219 RepID=A0A8T3BBL1_DENNO|nr:hypothetical protein KFK09_014323 [Dendrobium nobile]